MAQNQQSPDLDQAAMATHAAALRNMTLVELRAWLQATAQSPAHATAIFAQLYRTESTTDSGLSATLRRTLESMPALPLTVKTAQISDYDGSVKLLLGCAAGGEIEAVIMPERRRITVCLSSQVGCARACSFCHTGRMGLRRNLDADEIVGQVLLANRWIVEHPEWRQRYAPSPFAGVHSGISNAVFMGMGEPLDNVTQVVKAIQIMTEPAGLGMGLRHISVSTAGHLEGLRALTAAIPKVRLAWSLHAPHNALRSKLMPINRIWPLEDLVEFFIANGQRTGLPLLIQYTLIGGVNEYPQAAEMLADLLSPIESVKVNLIPFNVVGPSAFRSPEPEAVEAFRDALYRRGIRVMVRYSKGQDIAAACGQLVTLQNPAPVSHVP